MKLTKTHAMFAHILLGLVVFGIGIWIQGYNYKGVNLGLLLAVAAGIGKEVNDEKGYLPFLLTDGKTKTGFNWIAAWVTIGIPLVFAVIYNAFLIP